MIGNHLTWCTFTMQQINTWVVTHSKADSNFHGHGLATCRNQCPLWILLMSQHLNPASALSEHRESVAWLISNGPHSAAYCHKLGPNRVKAECLCPTRLPPSSNTLTQPHIALGHAKMQGGFFPSSLARFHCARSATTWPWSIGVQKSGRCPRVSLHKAQGLHFAVQATKKGAILIGREEHLIPSCAIQSHSRSKTLHISQGRSFHLFFLLFSTAPIFIGGLHGVAVTSHCIRW